MKAEKIAQQARNLEAVKNLYEKLNGESISRYTAATLLKEFKRMENKLSALATNYCNTGSEKDETYLSQYETKVRQRMKKIFPTGLKNLKINRDPRGYQMQIEAESEGRFEYADCGFETDWGGNLILCFY
jgi:hypothetical protein